MLKRFVQDRSNIPAVAAMQDLAAEETPEQRAENFKNSVGLELCVVAVDLKIFFRAMSVCSMEEKSGGTMRSNITQEQFSADLTTIRKVDFSWFCKF
jgi:hypothetical protein